MNHSQKTEVLTNEDVAIERLSTNTVALVKHARNIAVQQVNMIQLLTYYTIGKWIIEVQQKGETRARYGSQVIKRLSEEMKKNFERGFSEDSLKSARKFYLTYKDRIDETVFNLFAVEKSETVFSFFEEKPPFIVLWSHYLQLMRIENEDERSFYEIESMQMYVNYDDRYEKLEDENPTIGILLCKENNDALVEITLPRDANIYASEYKLYLPDKKLLQDKLQQWIEEVM